MKTKILALKKELKTLASEIRTKKSQRCAANNGFIYGLAKNQKDYRIKHIVYCLVRGRTMEQIESKVNEHNKLSDWELSTIASAVELYSAPEEVL